MANQDTNYNSQFGKSKNKSKSKNSTANDSSKSDNSLGDKDKKDGTKRSNLYPLPKKSVDFGVKGGSKPDRPFAGGTNSIDVNSTSNERSERRSGSSERDIPFLDQNEGARVKFSSSSKDWATPREQRSVDPVTGGVYCPVLFEQVTIDPAGYKSSLASNAFWAFSEKMRNVSRAILKPEIVNRVFENEFIVDYFRYVSSLVSFRACISSYIALDALIKTGFFHPYPLLDEQLNMFIIKGVNPRGAVFKQLVEELDDQISRFYLPNDFRKIIDETYTPIFSALDRREQIIFHTVHLAGIESFYSASEISGRSLQSIGFSNEVINFPIDYSLSSKPTFWSRNIKNVIQQHVDFLNVQTKVDGALHQVHKIFKEVIPEFALKSNLHDIPAYRVSTNRDWTLTNVLRQPLPRKPYYERKNYPTFRNQKSGKENFGIPSKFYGLSSQGQRNVGFSTDDNSTVIINDRFSEVKVSTSRNYSVIALLSIDKSGFNFAVEDLILGSLVYEIIVRGVENVPGSADSISEPGIVYYENNSNGVHCLFHINNNVSDGYDNSVYKAQTLDSAKDLMISFNRFRFGRLVSPPESEGRWPNADEVSSTTVVNEFVSYDGMAAFDFTMNVVYPEIFSLISSYWGSSTLDGMADSARADELSLNSLFSDNE